jgi:hypothetical protein
MTTHDTPEAALALAARKAWGCAYPRSTGGHHTCGVTDDLAAAILAALDGWTLVPKVTPEATAAFGPFIAQEVRTGSPFADWAELVGHVAKERDDALAEVARLRAIRHAVTPQDD